MPVATRPAPRCSAASARRLPRPLPPGSTSSASTTPWRRRYCSPATSRPTAVRQSPVSRTSSTTVASAPRSHRRSGGPPRHRRAGTCIPRPPTRLAQPATVSHWPCAPGLRWQISSSSSSTRRCWRAGCSGSSVIGQRAARRRGASSTSTATRLPPVSTRWATLHPATSSPGGEAAIERTGADCVYLDTTPLHDFATRFPDGACGDQSSQGRHHRRQDPGCARRALPVVGSSPTSGGHDGPRVVGRGGA